METLWQDIRYAARTLSKRPAFLAVALITIGLGIGANTAIFSVVNSVLLRPLPYQDSDRIVRIIQSRPPGSVPEGIPLRMAAISTDDLQQLRTRAQMLSHIAAYAPTPMTLTQDGESTRVTGTVLSPAMFPLLGAEPLLGRAFDSGEERPGGASVVMISYTAWQKYFAGDPQILGRTVTLESRGYSVVGVMPEAFEFPDRDTEFWLPFILNPVVRTPGIRMIQIVQTIARLKDGIGLEAATAEANALFSQFREEENQFVAGNPGPPRGGPPPASGGPGVRGAGPGGPRPAPPPPFEIGDARIELVSLKDELVAPVRPALLVLLVAVGFVLLIACANVANLLLARAAGRQTEIAIRAALGAGRFRLIRQVLTESIMLALLGGILGTLLAYGGVQLLTATAADNIPRLEEIRIDLPVFAFTLAVSVLTGVLFGLVPALRVARSDHMQTIKEGAAAASSGADLFGRNRTRSVLAVAEISLAMILLAGSGLLINSFLKLSNVDTGYNPENLLTFQVPLPQARYPGAQRQAFYEQLLAQLRQFPQVQSVAVANALPMRQGGMMRLVFNFEGRPEATNPEDAIIADIRVVSSDYLSTMGIRLMEGRGFGERDRAGQPPVMLVNSTMARRYFQNGTAIGQRSRITGDRQPVEIVGIVGDVRYTGLDVDPVPEVYISLDQAADILPAPPAPPPPPGGAPAPAAERGFFLGPLVFGVRTAGDPIQLVTGVRGIVRQIDSQLIVDGIATMEQRLSDSVARPRFYAVLLGVFSAIAVALAAIGIYGLMAYSVSQRTREIGIRMALGAERSEVLGLVLKQGMILIGIGVTVGIIGALGLTRYLENMLFGLTATDPATFAAVGITIILIAFFACYIPARRATKIDPVVALRHE